MFETTRGEDSRESKGLVVNDCIVSHDKSICTLL